MKIKFKFLFIVSSLGLVLFFESCKKDDVEKVLELIVEATSPINEGSTVEVQFSLPEKLTKEGEIQFQINSSSSATYGTSQDYVIEGAAQDGNLFTIKIPNNSSSSKLSLKALRDSKLESDETIILDIVSSSSNIKKSSLNSSIQVILKDKTISLQFTKMSDTMFEGLKRKKITFQTNSPITEDVSFQISLDPGSTTATPTSDFTTSPSLSGGVITLPATVGSSEFGFLLSSNLDLVKENGEIVKFEFTNLPVGYGSDQSTSSIMILDNSLATGLIGEFLFDGSATDTSPNQNHGIVFGAVAGSDHLNSGQFAYSFDGLNDYVSIPHSDALNLQSTNFTISVWAEPAFPQATPSNAIFDIVRKWTGNHEGYPFAISFLNENSTVKNSFIAVRYDGSSCLNGPTLFSNPISSSSYNHIVLIKEGSIIKLYVNNVKVSETNDTTSCSQINTSHVTVGCRGQLLRYYTGKIDDLRFYNRALSTDEVDLLFKI